MQKSWKMRKHSSSLKVSLSSQKKSMSALPSLRRSILRLFKSWSVCAELCRGRKTHFSFKRALSEGDGGLSQQHHTGPGPALPRGRVCLFMLHNCCRIVNLQKGLQLPLQPLVSLNLLLQGFNANVQGGELQLDVLHGDPASRRLRNKEFGDEITLSQLQQYQQHRLHDNILHGGRREGGRKGGREGRLGSGATLIAQRWPWKTDGCSILLHSHPQNTAIKFKRGYILESISLFVEKVLYTLTYFVIFFVKWTMQINLNRSLSEVTLNKNVKLKGTTEGSFFIQIKCWC